MSDKIRSIYANPASDEIWPFVVGQPSAYSGREKPTTVTKIDKGMAVGPEGAISVYRVHCEDGEIKERIEIPAAFVPMVILEEEK